MISSDFRCKNYLTNAVVECNLLQTFALDGDGWRVISEEEYLKEKDTFNPFSNLSELLETKEDR